MRHAVEKDLAQIVEIYNSTIESGESTADTQKITVRERKEWFGEPLPKHTPSFRAGFMCFQVTEGRVLARNYLLKLLRQHRIWALKI